MDLRSEYCLLSPFRDIGRDGRLPRGQQGDQLIYFCFEIRFLYVTLAVLELSLYTRLASNSRDPRTQEISRVLGPKLCSTTAGWFQSLCSGSSLSCLTLSSTSALSRADGLQVQESGTVNNRLLFPTYQHLRVDRHSKYSMH